MSANTARFLAVLQPGERLVGEWRALSHGTRYALTHETFVAFDLMRDGERLRGTNSPRASAPVAS